MPAKNQRQEAGGNGRTVARQDLLAAVMRAFPADLKPAYGRNSPKFEEYFAERPKEMIEGLLSFRMNLAIGKWRSVLDRLSAKHGLSLNAWHTLFAVSVNGPDDTMTVIAKKINISNAALVRTLNDLEESGYIERKVDERDRRAKLLSLTERGDEVLYDLFHSINRVRRQLLTGISLPEIELVIEVLDRMDTNLDEILAADYPV